MAEETVKLPSIDYQKVVEEVCAGTERAYESSGAERRLVDSGLLIQIARYYPKDGFGTNTKEQGLNESLRIPDSVMRMSSLLGEPAERSSQSVNTEMMFMASTLDKDLEEGLEKMIKIIDAVRPEGEKDIKKVMVDAYVARMFPKKEHENIREDLTNVMEFLGVYRVEKDNVWESPTADHDYMLNKHELALKADGYSNSKYSLLQAGIYVLTEFVNSKNQDTVNQFMANVRAWKKGELKTNRGAIAGTESTRREAEAEPVLTDEDPFAGAAEESKGLFPGGESSPREISDDDWIDRLADDKSEPEPTPAPRVVKTESGARKRDIFDDKEEFELFGEETVAKDVNEKSDDDDGLPDWLKNLKKEDEVDIKAKELAKEITNRVVNIRKSKVMVKSGAKFMGEEVSNEGWKWFGDESLERAEMDKNSKIMQLFEEIRDPYAFAGGEDSKDLEKRCKSALIMYQGDESGGEVVTIINLYTNYDKGDVEDRELVNPIKVTFALPVRDAENLKKMARENPDSMGAFLEEAFGDVFGGESVVQVVRPKELIMLDSADLEGHEFKNKGEKGVRALLDDLDKGEDKVVKISSWDVGKSKALGEEETREAKEVSEFVKDTAPKKDELPNWMQDLVKDKEPITVQPEEGSAEEEIAEEIESQELPDWLKSLDENPDPELEEPERQEAIEMEADLKVDEGEIGMKVEESSDEMEAFLANCIHFSNNKPQQKIVLTDQDVKFSVSFGGRSHNLTGEAISKTKGEKVQLVLGSGSRKVNVEAEFDGRKGFGNASVTVDFKFDVGMSSVEASDHKERAKLLISRLSAFPNLDGWIFREDEGGSETGHHISVEGKDGGSFQISLFKDDTVVWLGDNRKLEGTEKIGFDKNREEMATLLSEVATLLFSVKSEHQKRLKTENNSKELVGLWQDFIRVTTGEDGRKTLGVRDSKAIARISALLHDTPKARPAWVEVPVKGSDGRGRKVEVRFGKGLTRGEMGYKAVVSDVSTSEVKEKLELAGWEMEENGNFLCAKNTPESKTQLRIVKEGSVWVKVSAVNFEDYDQLPLILEAVNVIVNEESRPEEVKEMIIVDGQPPFDQLVNQLPEEGEATFELSEGQFGEVTRGLIMELLPLDKQKSFEIVNIPVSISDEKVIISPKVRIGQIVTPAVKKSILKISENTIQIPEGVFLNLGIELEPKQEDLYYLPTSLSMELVDERLPLDGFGSGAKNQGRKSFMAGANAVLPKAAPLLFKDNPELVGKSLEEVIGEMLGSTSTTMTEKVNELLKEQLSTKRIKNVKITTFRGKMKFEFEVEGGKKKKVGK